MGKHKKNLSEGEIVLYPLNLDLSKRWYVDFFNPAKNRIDRKWISSGLKTKKARLQAFEDIKTELLTNGFAAKSNIPDAFQPTLRASKRLKNALTGKNHLRKKSKSSYKSKLKLFDDFCQMRGHVSITEAVAKDYLNYRIEQGKSAATINNDRTVLKNFVRSVNSSSTIKNTAFDKTKKLRGGGGAGRDYYQPHQKKLIKAYFDAHYPALWFACKFVYYCYVRNGNELRNLKVSDLDLHLNRLRITSDESKNGQDERIVIPRAFADELRRMDYSKYPQHFYLVGADGLPSEHKLPVDYWGKLHKKALDEMGFDRGGKRYSMYSWKNTGVVDSYLAKIGIKDLQSQLRHKNLQTTYLYLRALGLFDNPETFDVIPSL